uniref:Gfo/Idh/MocA-like oxidoreductase N-terminal domain-containing protein n=1 Tax=Coccolithus braarudii TaxID=221442 RepID=A0A7S0Q5X9_9EUKA
MLDLRRRGKVGMLGMVGTNGKKMPAVRAHMQRVLGDVFVGIEPSCIRTWPKDDEVDSAAYKTAITAFGPGDVAIIFTPDDTHRAIAEDCLAQGMHVMITKPPTKTLAEHTVIADAAAAAGKLCVIEVHKRYDPIYADARDRISALGDFSYFTAYMSQPKQQLETFKAWAGKSSDISFYLNSHHVDFCCWCTSGRARPERVTALCSTGVANTRLEGVETEDTITLAVQWRNRSSSTGTFKGGSMGHALFTSSWIAPKADVHSQQRWFYMGQKGEISVDQAHRGYTVCSDEAGYGSVNPLFWKPTVDASTGLFAGQRCYGYLSFEAFIDAAAVCNKGDRSPSDFDTVMPTMATTHEATAILEAGRLSLDAGGLPFELVYHDDASITPTSITPVQLTPTQDEQAHKRLKTL